MTTDAAIPPFLDYAAASAAGGPVVFADCRWYGDGRSPRAEYERAHLPGAVFVDLERWLSGPASALGGRHPLPDPETFSQAMAAAGIGDADLVVAYDDANGVIAARLVWMLRATGRRAAILDGGIAGYPGELTTEEPVRPPARFAVRPWPADATAGIDEVAAPGALTVDARPRHRFEGEGALDPLDPRFGHIPGAVSVPCRENVGPDGRLLAADLIRATFAAAGVDDAQKLISYCGSGVTGCHVLLTAEHVGLGRGRLFVGGWSAWGADASREAETGPARRATADER